MWGLGRWLEVWWAPPHLWRAVTHMKNIIRKIILPAIKLVRLIDSGYLITRFDQLCLVINHSNGNKLNNITKPDTFNMTSIFVIYIFLNGFWNFYSNGLAYLDNNPVLQHMQKISVLAVCRNSCHKEYGIICWCQLNPFLASVTKPFLMQYMLIYQIITMIANTAPNRLKKKGGSRRRNVSQNGN